MPARPPAAYKHTHTHGWLSWTGLSWFQGGSGGLFWHTIACPWQKMSTLDSVWVSKKHLWLNLMLIQAVAFTVGLVFLYVGWVSSITGMLWSSVTTIMPVCVQRGASGCPSLILRQVSPRATATSGWRNGTEGQVGHTHSHWSVSQPLSRGTLVENDQKHPNSHCISLLLF